MADPMDSSSLRGEAPAKIGKCVTKYADADDRLHAQALADASRFVDNGNRTLTDNLTPLQWGRRREPFTVTGPRIRTGGWGPSASPRVEERRRPMTRRVPDRRVDRERRADPKTRQRLRARPSERPPWMQR